MPSCGLQIEMYEIYHLDIAKEQPCLYKNNSDNIHTSAVYKRESHILLLSRYERIRIMNTVLSVTFLSSVEERRYFGCGVPSSSAPVGGK